MFITLSATDTNNFNPPQQRAALARLVEELERRKLEYQARERLPFLREMLKLIVLLNFHRWLRRTHFA
jgi:hypothetical protein